MGLLERMQERAEVLDRMKAILDRAKAEGRDLTPAEAREFEKLDARFEVLSASLPHAHEVMEAMRRAVEAKDLSAVESILNEPLDKPFRPQGPNASHGDSTAGTAFGRAIMAAGFNLRQRPVVEVPLALALPDEEVWRPRRRDDILPLGRDERFLFPLLPSQNLDNATSIEDFRQASRTVTGSVERSPAATTEKAKLDVTIEHVVEEVAQFAVVIEKIPNAVLDSLSSARAFFDSEGRYVVAQAIDDHIYARILAANPPSSSTGANLVEQVRNAIAAMRADGMNPDVLVVTPEDAAALDLFRQPGTNDYMFTTREAGVASPLWNLRVVERRADSSGAAPMLLDTRRIGVRYRGRLQVAADPFTGFKTNTTDLRFEVNGLMHVRNPKAAHLIVEQAA